MSAKHRTIDLNLETDVLTRECVGRLIVAVFEYLLFQRRQIPFVFRTFKYLISQWKENNEDEEFLENFQLQRQKSYARETMTAIKAISEEILNRSNTSNINSIRFLFGSTPMTPKEAYTIIMPQISDTHLNDNHKTSTEGVINKIVMSLLTSNDLYEMFSRNLSPTNVFLEMELESSSHYCSIKSNSIFCIKDCDELPRNCYAATINIYHRLPANAEVLKCCKHMEVFQDLANLTFDEEMQKLNLENSQTKKMWYETSIMLRGFRDKTVKSKSIWDNIV